MTHALELNDVTKRYVGHLAVDRLTLGVPAGSIYGILGPNGAGKSTTLRMVMHIIARDSGSIAVLGSDPATDRRVLRRVGYLPEERGLYRKMKVVEVLEFLQNVIGKHARTVIGLTVNGDVHQRTKDIGLGLIHGLAAAACEHERPDQHENLEPRSARRTQGFHITHVVP